MAGDELCLLCGIAPTGGCSALFRRSNQEEYACEIAEEVKPGDDETLQIVHDAFEALMSKEEECLGFKSPWLPAGMGCAPRDARVCIAVGYFDDEGVCEVRDDKIPDGRNVEVRRVRSCNAHMFDIVIREVNGRAKAFDEPSQCSVVLDINPNFALCERCYRYLEAWLDQDSLPLPSTVASANGLPLSFASELYEIVNSRVFNRERYPPGHLLLKEIDYDGIEDTVHLWQNYYIYARRGVKYISNAIEAGQRGKDLMPAILRDCRTWMFMRPDQWPKPAEGMVLQTFTPYRPTTTSSMPLIGRLPNELLLLVLADMPLKDILSVASCCRYLHALVLDASFISCVLKDSILHGCLRWVIPVDTAPGELRRAYDPLRLWIPEEHRPEPYPGVEADHLGLDENVDGQVSNEEDDPAQSQKTQFQPRASSEHPVSEHPTPSVQSLILSPHFPTVQFVRACWASDSMMSRKRLWGQVCQFRELWREYRVHGWQADRFFPSDEINMPVDGK